MSQVANAQRQPLSSVVKLRYSKKMRSKEWARPPKRCSTLGWNADVAVLHGSSSSDAAYPTCTPCTAAFSAAAPVCGEAAILEEDAFKGVGQASEAL
jgi:hypothetical protein